MEDFLPPDYEVPKSSGKYYKFQQGENRFRIVSRPIIGFLGWKDKQPHRFKMKDKPQDVSIYDNKRVQHFWAMVIWDYRNNCVSILEITQTTIQEAIESFTKDDDWGNPLEYDIKVIKTGESLETKYQVNPCPRKELSDEIKKVVTETPVNLEALYSGGDPFEAKTVVSEDEPF